MTSLGTRSERVLLVVTITVVVLTACQSTRAEPATPTSQEWIEVSIFCQVCPEPWGEDDDQIKPFFADKGVKVYDQRRTAREVCHAEACPSAVKKEILIDATQIQQAYEILISYPGVVGSFERLIGEIDE